jgi:hypothetical protein
MRLYIMRHHTFSMVSLSAKDADDSSLVAVFALAKSSS